MAEEITVLRLVLSSLRAKRSVPACSSHKQNIDIYHITSTTLDADGVERGIIYPLGYINNIRSRTMAIPTGYKIRQCSNRASNKPANGSAGVRRNSLGT